MSEPGESSNDNTSGVNTSKPPPRLAPSQTISGQTTMRSTNHGGDNGVNPQQPQQGPKKGGKPNRPNTNHSNTKEEGKSPAEQAPGAQQAAATPNEKKNNNRNRNRSNKVAPDTAQKSAAAPGAAASDSVQDSQTAEQAPGAQRGVGALKKKKNNNRNRNRSNKEAPNTAQEQTGGTAAASDTAQSQIAEATKSRRNRNRRNNNKNTNKRFPWRRHIPDESVDPITLEPLSTLPYPPFALYAEIPYDPIAVWPFPENEQTGAEEAKARETEDERQQRILREQWGTHLDISKESTNTDESQQQKPPEIRHVHLYDGRALAYYMVSQLQFIDPLNRRDLTRPEIVNLDGYLKRHGFHNLKVVEAYDAKGVDLSRAGAAANTAAGRARILQQEAAVLLDALFGRRPSLPNRSSQSNALAAGYQAHEQQQARQRQQRGRSAQQQQTPAEDLGIYGDVDGILVIDDDLNPGLRGNNTSLRVEADEFVPGGGSGSAPFTLWSARHIASQFGHQAETRAAEFPALAAPASEAPAPPPPKKKILPKSNTLAKIAVSVKKTDPEERQRMWEAHEAWRRRTLMANLTFGGANPVGLADPLQPPMQQQQALEGQLERNRALAEALGVNQKTLRHVESNGALKSGWTRSTVGRDVEYPDALLAEAREQTALLVKLERRWKLFLEDDGAASCPLWPMDRPTRTFVHKYSDFWRLQTESFDPEPKRYIHCVKLLDTSSPFPLLSDAARQWRGPSPQPQPHSNLATPRTGKGEEQAVGEAITQSSRFGVLEHPSPPRERPKLELQKRTLPLELPPYEPAPAASQDNEFNSQKERQLRQQRMEEKARREREQVEAQKRALEAAFASDDEEDKERNYDEEDDSEWSEPEPVYKGDSDED